MSKVTRKLDPIAGRRTPADYPLFLCVLTMLAIGLFMVLDASYAHAAQPGLSHGDPYYFFKVQLRWAAVGLVAMIWAMTFPYWKLARIGVPILILSAVLLILVKVPHLGMATHGAARWLRFGPIRIQPSELSKFCCVVFLAGYISRRPRAIRDLQTGLVGALLPVLAIAGLIIVEPDLGTALSLIGTSLIVLAVGGARPRHLGTIALIGMVLVGGLAMKHPYSRHRLLSFVSDGSDDRTYAYQVTQSVDALEAGGIHGLGPGQGDAKFFHVPAPYTDFIATTVGEEFGMIGSLALIGLFFCFMLRGLHIAHRCPNAFGCLLGTGICTMISLQALMNLAVISRSMPDTGVPLPMISYGGSSLVLVMFASGVLLSISRWPDLHHVDALLGSKTSMNRTPVRLDVDLHEVGGLRLR
jgi:cell division protein FtsW